MRRVPAVREVPHGSPAADFFFFGKSAMRTNFRVCEYLFYFFIKVYAKNELYIHV